MIEIVLSALLGAVFSLVLPLIFDHVRLKRGPDFAGEWLSRWEPKSPGRPVWVREHMNITIRFGRLKFENHNNECSYSYEGAARLVERRHLVGTWHSRRPGAYSSGAFLLTIAPQGGCMFGQIVGPNDEGVMEAGRFVLGRTPQDVEQGKRLLEEPKNAKSNELA